MRQAILLAGFAAVVAASPAPQAIDFSSVNAAPSPTLTGPPAGVNSQDVPYNTASAAAVGSAKATGVASASATATQPANVKRTFWWPWGYQPQPSKSTTVSSGSQPTSTPYGGSQPTTSAVVVKPTTAPSTTTTTQSPVSSTTSSDSSCPTQPEAGTYCGFINPEDSCAPQPDGYGPHVVPDTVEAFEAYPEFKTQALAATAPGYVSTFTNYNASVSANTYLGLTTLQTYDAPGCAKLCDNKDLCTGFNIFVERDPALNPSENCTQPASITNYKCTLWGSGVNLESATNYGQYRGQFQVVIAGSDGFEKTNTTTPPTQPGWQPPKQCGSNGSKAHNHPSTCIGQGFFPGPYDPTICAAYANAQNAINKNSPFWVKWFQLFTGTYNPYKCNFFNSYMLKKNGHHMGTYCSLFAQQYDGGYATYQPGYQGADYWSIESSFSFSIDVSAQSMFGF